MSDGPRSILVVDDSADIRGFMRAALEHEGYGVALAENGRQALDLQREQPAELLITDIFMPDVDGIETIARFKSEFPSVRVIAMSAGGAAKMQDYLRIAGYIGADAVLAKPFEVDELVRTVRRVL
jgi:DNA-binding response OmpR family regulator